MVGRTLTIVLVLAVLVGAMVFVGFRGIGATDRRFEEIEAEFRGQCLGAFRPHVHRAEELCTCLWHEVRGGNRMEMLKRLMALNNGTERDRQEFMSRISTECAHRLHIERP